MNNITRIQNPLKLTQSLFYLNAAVWVVAGAFTLWRMSLGGLLSQMGVILVGMLMFGNAFILLLAGIGLGERIPPTYLFAVLVLVVNILLTFTDQFGWLDLLTLLLDLLILALLMIFRKHFWVR